MFKNKHEEHFSITFSLQQLCQALTNAIMIKSCNRTIRFLSYIVVIFFIEITINANRKKKKKKEELMERYSYFPVRYKMIDVRINASFFTFNSFNRGSISAAIHQ